jgi:hypothetical protein
MLPIDTLQERPTDEKGKSTEEVIFRRQNSISLLANEKMFVSYSDISGHPTASSSGTRHFKHYRSRHISFLPLSANNVAVISP